jgi:hypothetical protein
MRGHEIFAGELCRAGLTALGRRVTAAPLVAVHGRPGVGVTTVRAALSLAGLKLAGLKLVGLDLADGADVDVLVLAEVVKPEDLGVPATLAVLNKADLSGFGPGGPIAAAERRCAEVTGRLGAPTVPLVALLTVAALDAAVVDDELLAALRVLVDEPADLRSPDGFVACDHPLPRVVRQRLVDVLDLFGIAHGVVVLRRADAGAPEVRAALRQISRIDEMVHRLTVLAAEAYYRRVRTVVDELSAMAVTDAGIAEFLAADDTVLAQMAAAVDAVEAVGMRVDPADDADAHLRRAVHWRALAAGPLAAVYLDCATVIARGSLRLLAGRAA